MLNYQSQDFEYLCSVIESDLFAGHFYIAANTTSWLYKWMNSVPEIQAVREKASLSDNLATFVVERAWQLFCDGTKQERGVRSEHEAALCVYSFILCSIIKPSYGYQMLRIEDATFLKINRIVQDMRDLSNPRHGWLKRVINRSLRSQTINERILERHVPFTNRLTSVQSQTTNEQSNNAVRVSSNCAFEFVSEQWTQFTKAA